MSKAARFLAFCLLAFGMASANSASFDAYTLKRNVDGSVTVHPSMFSQIKDVPSAFQTTPSGGVVHAATGNITTPNNKSLPVSVLTNVNKTPYVQAFAKLSKALPLVGTVAVLAEIAVDLKNAGTDAVVQPTPEGGQWIYLKANETKHYIVSGFCPVQTVGTKTDTICLSHAEWIAGLQKTYPTRTFEVLTDQVSGTNVLWRVRDSWYTIYQAQRFSELIPAPPTIASDQIIEPYLNGQRYKRTIDDFLNNSSEPVPVQTPSVVTGPSSSVVSVTNSTNPSGETFTTTKTENYNYNQDTISFSTSTTTINNTTGASYTNTTNTYTNPATPQTNQEIETCGLPGKPACKLDETGTPTAPEVNPVLDAQNAIKSLSDCVANITSCAPEFPDLNWTFSFPSGCSAISMDAFAPFMTSIDVCRFQPVIHDIMSMIWAAAGLFGAVRLLFRDATGS